MKQFYHLHGGWSARLQTERLALVAKAVAVTDETAVIGSFVLRVQLRCRQLQLFGLEMNAVLAELLGGNQIGRFGIELTELAEAGKIGVFDAGADGQELEVVGEGI